MNIDVLIPVASQSKFIRDAVHSATQQSGNKNIFIIENNIGSPEYSSYLQELAAEYSIEYVYFDVRLPIFENWQRCLTVGKSEWVAFLHDDDIWSRNCLEIFSKIGNSSDIVFFDFKCFEGTPLMGESQRDPIVTTMENREKLLAKMMCTDHHVSSALFRRSLKLTFPTNYKMIADQMAYRELVANNRDIRIAWVNMDSPTLIRVHPNQGTRTGASLYAGLEFAISYRAFLETISREHINTEKFCNELVACCTDDTLSAILSAVFFRKPYVFSVKITTDVLVAKKSVKLLLATLVRLIAQDLVWSAKLFLAKNRH